MKKIRQTAGRFEPSRAQCLLDTQKSLSERYLITFAFREIFGRKSFSLRALGPERHEKSNHGTNFRSKMFIGSTLCAFN
jgi:hypothetical protein